MIWLNPIAAVGLLAIAAPIVIHILARQRAVQRPFPTLRFIAPHPLAAIRRRALEDAVLLAVRALAIAAAAAAVAGPFLITEARRRAWDARTIRADVTGDPRQGLARAAAWLESQPPGRREIVVRSPLVIGSLAAADIAAVPAFIGLRFEPTAAPAQRRVVPLAPIVAAGSLIAREGVLDGDRTSVREAVTGAAAALPVEIVTASDQRGAADALRQAVRSARATEASPNHSARVVFGAGTTMHPIDSAWMADAAVRIARALGPLTDVSFGSDDGRLIVVTKAGASDPSALELVRAVERGLAAPADRPEQEILPIPEAQRRAWARAPGSAPTPTAAAIDRDDRRWLWMAVLLVLGAEAWLRRRPRAAGARMTEPSTEEPARVA